MIAEHYDAIKALIPPGVTVHLYQPELSKPPATTDYPYVLLWGNLGDEVSGESGDKSAAATIDQIEFRIRATYVGLSGAALGIVAKRTRAALSRARPVVTGWAPSRLTQSSLMDAQTDLDVTVASQHPVYAVDEYRFTSSKTT